jgi:hypothetical protein
MEVGKTCRVAFSARSQPLRLRLPELMKAGPPWSEYGSVQMRRAVEIGAEWRIISQLYEANATADDGRLTFFLGGRLPAGATLRVDSLSFAEATPAEVASVLPMDIGNLIFETGRAAQNLRGTAAAAKTSSAMTRIGSARMYSVGNPARHHTIDCALARHLIDETA